jgi:hypothetical protein
MRRDRNNPMEGREVRAMVDIRATTMPPEFTVPETIRTARAEALYLSTLQPSESPSPDRVRRNIATTLGQLALPECDAQIATDFGDHPDTAVARMRWALTTIDTVYPSTSGVPTPQRLQLVAAS